jgi:YesN/AraC family two-component response regulator
MKDILLVDDENSFLMSLADGIRSVCGGKCNVFTAQNGIRALEVLRTIMVDVVVTDLRMPEMDGFELIAYLKKHHPDIAVIVMTAYSDQGLEPIMQNHRVKYIAEKPIDLSDIANKILAA